MLLVWTFHEAIKTELILPQDVAQAPWPSISGGWNLHFAEIVVKWKQELLHWAQLFPDSVQPGFPIGSAFIISL